MKNYQITILGDVVHKGYRFRSMQLAYQLGITGFVQNKDKNTVVIEAEGEYEKLEEFLDWCKSGPIGARVKDVICVESEIKGYLSFEIIHSNLPKSSLENLPVLLTERRSLLKKLSAFLKINDKSNHKS